MSGEAESPAAAVVRQTVDAYIAGDQDGAWRNWDEDSVGIAPEGWPEPGPFVGREAVRAIFDTWDTAFGKGWQGDMSVERLIDLGDGRVLVEIGFAPKGTASGVPLDEKLAAIYTVEDDRIARAQFFLGHEAARKEAGLE